MRPTLIALAIAAVVGALTWTFLRGSDANRSAPELPELATPTTLTDDDDESRLADVSTKEVVRREAEASAPVDAQALPEEPSPPLVDPAIAGILEVRVVEFETGRPLAGAHVALHPERGADDAGVQWLGGAPEQTPTTDEEGVARFHLTPETDYQLWASVSHTESAGAGSHAGESVTPLRTGEQRTLTLRLRTGPDLKIVGRVIDGSTRAGVADASVRFALAGMTFGPGGGRQSTVEVVTQLVTDTDGWFEGEAASWRHLHGRIDAAGYGTALFPLRHGNATRENAIVVELTRSATLRGRVIGAEDPAALVVRVEADGHSLMARHEAVMTYAGEVTWEVALDPDGRWEHLDLTPNVGLKLEVRREDEVLRREPERLSLAPGETRELEWLLGSGAVVSGRVTVADDGAPLARHPVWLLPAKDVSGKFQFGSAPTARTETDDQGRFTFEDVSPGEWKVGPAPVRNDWEQAKPDEVVAMGQAVTVLHGVSHVEVDLTVYRGLFIRGEVLGSDGTRLTGPGWIWGHGMESGLWVNGDVQDGRFAFGPLVPGTYKLTASGGSGAFAPSLEVEARAGDEGVVLRLRVGGSIHGRLVDDASGDPLQGEVVFILEGQRVGGPTMTMAQPDGRFELRGVLPGTYRIRGRSGALVGEARTITVAPEREVRDVEVRLSSGVALELNYNGVVPGGWYRIESDDVPVSFARAEPGSHTTSRHIPGQYTVRLTLPLGAGEGVREIVREVSLVAGETTVLEFDDESE